MIPRLDEDGRLIPPSSRTEGVERVRQLRHECAKIETQLSTPTTRFKHIEDALRWRSAASRKLNQFRTEEMQLAAWLSGHKAAVDVGEGLLKRAYDALQGLEIEYEFTEDQELLMEALDVYYSPTNPCPKCGAALRGSSDGVVVCDRCGEVVELRRLA